MSTNIEFRKKTIRRETALFLILFLIGILVLPSIIYFIGRTMFGEYGGTGFSAFYGTIHGKLRSGEPAVWFLVLSPYLIWQSSRLTLLGFLRLGKSQSQIRS